MRPRTSIALAVVGGLLIALAYLAGLMREVQWTVPAPADTGSVTR